MQLPDTTDSRANDLVAELKNKANQLDASSDNLDTLLTEIDSLSQYVHLILINNCSIDRGIAVRSLQQIEHRLNSLAKSNTDTIDRYRKGISARLENLSTAV